MTILKEMRTENTNVLMRMFKNATFDDFFKGVVVLANPKTVVNDKFAKKEVKNKVIRADQLIRFIKENEQNSKELASSMKDMIVCGQSYLNYNVEDRPEYIKKYEELVAELGALDDSEVKNTSEPDSITSISDESLKCPRCGNMLVLRTAKKGDNAGNQFYGCSSFPKCRYMRNI